MRVLGLDPGSRRTGFGVIDCCGGKLTVVAHGCLNVAAAAPTARLRILFEGLQALVSEHHPTEVAVERVFVSRADHARAHSTEGTSTRTHLGWPRAAARHASRSAF